eukprot:1101009-Prymnesium_polylepis.2
MSPLSTSCGQPHRASRSGGCALDSDGEFPLGTLLQRDTRLFVVHSTQDPTLAQLWPIAEYTRCGRNAPPALGLTEPAGPGGGRPVAVLLPQPVAHCR